MDAQFQIRQNALEVQDYVKDLFEWEREVKKSDSDIAKGGKRKESKKVGTTLPPVRGRVHSVTGESPAALQAPSRPFARDAANHSEQPKPQRKSKGSKRTSGSCPGPKHAAGHTYDNYRRWDSFDSEASDASASGDEKNCGAEAEVAGVSSASVGRQRSQRKSVEPATNSGAVPAPAAANSQDGTAEGWKDKGNEYFRMGEYELAEEAYTRSLSVEPSFVAHANRAMALLKLQKYESALQDCDAALELEPMYIKAYQRRAAARLALKDLEGALQDAEMVVRLEPDSKAHAQERKRLLGRVKEQGKLGDAQKQSAVLRVALPPAAAPARDAAALTLAAESAANHSPPLELASAAGGSTTAAATAPKAEVVGVEAVAVEPEMEMESSRQDAMEVQPVECQAADSNTSKRTASAAAASPAASPAKRTPQLPVAGGCSPPGRRGAGALQAPATSIEFEAAWKQLGSSPQDRVAYLALLKPARLKKLFKSSLTPPTLLSIASCALLALSSPPQHPPPEPAASPSVSSTGDPCGLLPAGRQQHLVALLAALPKVPRFSMCLLCLSQQDKAALHSAWEAAHAALADVDATLLDTLVAARSAYGL